MPQSVNGIGTTYYGKRDFEENGSYITTEWVIFLYLPIVPVASFRVVPLPIFDPLAAREYYVKRVSLHPLQVWKWHLLLGIITGLLGISYVSLNQPPISQVASADTTLSREKEKSKALSSDIKASSTIEDKTLASPSARPQTSKVSESSSEAEFSKSSVNDGSKPYYSYKQPKVKVADNGSPFPSKSGYIKGYPKTATNGSSILEIDNSKNDADAFIKVVIAGSNKSVAPIRVVLVKAGESFTMENITAGKYEVKDQDVTSGHKSRTDAFELVEDKGQTLSLYKVANGNMQSYSIGDDEF
jgi:hypothetical protein